MAPASIEYCNESVASQDEGNNLSQTLFEGAEKKLSIMFTANKSSREHEKDLRNLSRKQVELITGAANCTILSVKSNGIINSYLLSESSLFISKNELVIKTCGTTTLLKAVPIIFVLAESVGLFPVELKFTRVSYLFPEQQIYPHDSFRNEINYLDAFLKRYKSTNAAKLKRQVVQHKTSTSSEWYAYVVSFNDAHIGINVQLRPKPMNEIYSSKIMVDNHHREVFSSASKKTLEVCMFDLHPNVMKNFMFENERDIIGRDNPSTGVTHRCGIKDLLVNTSFIDAFNFDPCGYSMNAISSCGGYTTIHITPEQNASYVSFETNVENAELPEILLSVVTKFLPGRFTVSLVSSNAVSTFQDQQSSISMFGKILNAIPPKYASFSNPYIGKWSSGVAIITGFNMINKIHNHSTNIYRLKKDGMIYITDKQFNRPLFSGIRKKDNISTPFTYGSSKDGINYTNFTRIPDKNIMILDYTPSKVSEIIRQYFFEKTYGNYKIKILSSPSYNDDDDLSSIIVLDLTEISNNFIRTRYEKSQTLNELQIGQKVEFKFIVGACFDIQVLRFFAKFSDVIFEVSDNFEIEALNSVGVERSRISLSARPLMQTHVKLFSSVNSVNLNNITNQSILNAIHDAQIYANMVFCSSKQISQFASDVCCNHSSLYSFCALNNVPIRIIGSYDVSENFSYDRFPTIKCIENENKENEIARTKKSLINQTEIGEGSNLTESSPKAFEREMQLKLGEELEASSKNEISIGVREEKEQTNCGKFCPKVKRDDYSLDVISWNISESVFKGAITIILTVIGSRIRENGNGNLVQDVFLNDGVYGVLAGALMRYSCSREEKIANSHVSIISPKPLFSKSLKRNGRKLQSALWGPTCDSADLIWEGDLNVLNVGDRIAFDGNTGIFASRYSSSFNGFDNSMKRTYISRHLVRK